MKKDGGPAFPGGVNSVYTDREQGCPTQDGMTLRDYFAAAVLQGWDCPHDARDHSKRAEWAYAEADALIAERDKS